MTEETRPTETCDDEEHSEFQQQIVDMGSSTVKTQDGTIHTLTIVGTIEGHQEERSGAKTTKYEHVLPLLTAVEESTEADGLRKPTVSLVLGGGHSIGVPLAVAAKESFIVPSGAMTIHPVRLNGLVIGVSQTFHYFERIQDRICDFVTRNSRISREDFEHLMLNTGEMAADVGSVIYGQEAVELGLIDHLGGLSDALACLHRRMREERERQEREAT